MTTSSTLRAFRLLPVGGGKAQTNEQSNGQDLEDDKTPFRPV
jgi:hypothetical protein